MMTGAPRLDLDIAENHELVTFLPGQARLPTGGTERGQRAVIGPGAGDFENAVLFAGRIRFGVAVKIEIVVARFQARQSGRHIAAIGREDVGVIHGIAGRVAPNAGSICQFKRDLRGRAIGQFKSV